MYFAVPVQCAYALAAADATGAAAVTAGCELAAFLRPGSLLAALLAAFVAAFFAVTFRAAVFFAAGFTAAFLVATD
jgi:hypothetical protein